MIQLPAHLDRWAGSQVGPPTKLGAGSSTPINFKAKSPVNLFEDGVGCEF